MKRLSKIFINIFAVLMLTVACFGFAGCKEDITQIKLTVSVYNHEVDEDGLALGFEDVTLTVDLYGHFAPKTVSSILSYVKSGYYNNTAFYKIDSSYPNQIMLGDYLVEKDTIVSQTKIMPQIQGEFERGGTSGSNLVAKKGAIGLWRTWYAYDDSYNVSNQTMHSGRATWFFPTNEVESTLSGYNGWFCLFAQMDMENEDNVYALDLIEAALVASNVQQYEVYYTGEYDATQVDNNHGLTKNVVLKDDFVLSEVEDLFVAEGSQEVLYNRHTINVPVVTVNEQTKIAAYVKTASVA